MTDTHNRYEDWPRGDPPASGTGLPGAALLEIWRARGWLLLWVALAAVAAFALSFVLPASYTATATFIPSRQSPQDMGSLSRLTGVLGSLPGEATDSPVFYARLVKSREVLTTVAQADYTGGTLVEYFGLAGEGEASARLLRELNDAISVSVDRIPGIVRVDVTLRGAQLAVEVAAELLQSVDHFNSSLNRTNARNKRQFLEEQQASAEAQLQSAEADMEVFLQQNRTIDSPVLTYQKAKLERRILMAQELYLGLSRQLQNARVEELNNTPVISVIDAPFPPERPSFPRPVFMVVIAIILAGLLGILAVLILRRRHWLSDPQSLG